VLDRTEHDKPPLPIPEQPMTPAEVEKIDKLFGEPTGPDSVREIPDLLSPPNNNGSEGPKGESPKNHKDKHGPGLEEHPNNHPEGNPGEDNSPDRLHPSNPPTGGPNSPDEEEVKDTPGHQHSHPPSLDHDILDKEPILDQPQLPERVEDKEEQNNPQSDHPPGINAHIPSDKENVDNKEPSVEKNVTPKHNPKIEDVPQVPQVSEPEEKAPLVEPENPEDNGKENGKENDNGKPNQRTNTKLYGQKKPGINHNLPNPSIEGEHKDNPNAVEEPTPKEDNPQNIKANAVNSLNDVDLNSMIAGTGVPGLNGPQEEADLHLPKGKNSKEKTVHEQLGPTDADIDTDPLGYLWTDIFLKSDLVKESELQEKYTKEDSKLLHKVILVDGTYIYDTEK